MKELTFELENKLDELLSHLEGDIIYLQNCLQYLDELRRLVIKRDETGLRGLLDVIQAESDSHKKHESARQLIRKELADCLGCSCEQMTLTALESGRIAGLPQDKHIHITSCRAKLKALIDRLKVEYSSTAMLLSECSRFNSLILKSVFALGKTGGIYYNASGAAKRQNESAFVNLRF